MEKKQKNITWIDTIIRGYGAGHGNYNQVTNSAQEF